MRLALGLLTCLCIGSVTEALAADPPSQAATSTSTATSTTSAATDSATAKTTAPATANAPAAPAGNALSDAEEKKLISSGYRIETKKGEKFYCRREAQMGTRFEHKVCSTAEQIKVRQQDDEDAVRRSQQQQMNPQGH